MKKKATWNVFELIDNQWKKHWQKRQDKIELMRKQYKMITSLGV